MTAELKIAVERLYEVFGKYPGNPDMPVSPLKGEQAELNGPLFSKPLRLLTKEDLDYFTASLITTWGDIPDLKHFLPRILELTAELNAPSWDLEVFMRKLSLARWTEWDVTEQQVLIEYFKNLWRFVLQLDDPRFLDFHGYYVGLSMVYPEYNELLNDWLGMPGSLPAEKLAEYVFDNNAEIFGRKKPVQAELIEWLLSEEVHRKLTNAFFEISSSNQMAQTISTALQILENEKFNRGNKHTT